LLRAIDTALIGALCAKWQPSHREFGILMSAWSEPRYDLDDDIHHLIRKRATPERVHDFAHMIACSSPSGVASLVSERLAGYLPADIIQDIAEVAGPLAFGATITVKPLNGASHAR
jgi:hypothetical protein